MAWLGLISLIWQQRSTFGIVHYLNTNWPFILVLCGTANSSYNISFVYSVYGSRLAGRLGVKSQQFWIIDLRELWEWVSCRVVWDQSERRWSVGWPVHHTTPFDMLSHPEHWGKTCMQEVLVRIQTFWALQVLYITVNYYSKTIHHWLASV